MYFLISPASLAKTVALTCVKMIYDPAFTLASSPGKARRHEAGKVIIPSTPPNCRFMMKAP